MTTAPPITLSRRQEFLLDLAAFVVTLSVAISQRWSTTDLVWSLWITSLLLGYIYLLVSIAGQFRRHTQRAPLLGDIMVLAGTVFLVAFFSIHFLGFHLGHAFFLNQFFPLISVASLDPAQLVEFIRRALSLFWPFVLTSALSRYDEYQAAFRSDSPMMQPYKNVVRMHILIFVFAFLNAAGLSDYSLYPLLLFYFLPVRELIGFVRLAR